MNRLLRYGRVEDIPYYNCSGRSLEYWYSTGKKRPVFGWSLIIYGTFIEIFYIPVIFLFFKTKLIRYSCYKIMTLLGVIDVLAIVASSHISGYLLINGAVFCTNQTFIYISGCLGVSCWCAACAATLFLAINRVMDVIFPYFSKRVFERKWLYFGLLTIVFYGFYVFTFTPSVAFNTVIMAWLADPMVLEPQYKTLEIMSYYRNYVQNTNNWIFVVSTCSLYTLYCILVSKIQRGQNSNSSRQIFIQSTIICLFNTICAMTYNAIIFVTPSPWIVFFGEISWSLLHGCPALIYLTMNVTLRKELLNLFSKNNKIVQIRSERIFPSHFLQQGDTSVSQTRAVTFAVPPSYIIPLN